MIPVKLIGVGHSNNNGLLEQSMHKKELILSKGLLPGAIVYTEELKDFVTENIFFFNDTLGIDMAQNVTFGGTPEIIHNGSTSIEWTGSSGGGNWDFNDGGKVTITSANNNDNAIFTEQTATPVNIDNYTALTGKVDLDAFNPLTNDIVIQFDLAGILVGDSLSLLEYIDENVFTEQIFSIPKEDFNFGSNLVDGFNINIVRTAGTKPTISFDDIQLEETGSPKTFTAQPAKGVRFHISEFRIVIAAPLTGITTVAGATENATHPNLAFDKFMGLVLNIGFTIQRTTSGVSGFAASVKTIGDLLLAGANISNILSDGTNTHITLVTPFSHDIALNGNNNDKVTITINDDLSSLLKFSASIVGGRELKQLD